MPNPVKVEVNAQQIKAVQELLNEANDCRVRYDRNQHAMANSAIELMQQKIYNALQIVEGWDIE